MSDSFFEDVEKGGRRPLRGSKIGKKSGETMVLIGETWFKTQSFLVGVVACLAVVAFVFGIIYMVNRNVESQNLYRYTPSTNNQDMNFGGRNQFFTCPAGTAYNVSICSSTCSAQNTTVNCNSTALQNCSPTVPANGCYLTTPCDLSPWIGTDFIFASTVALTDNVLEIAPTYPACPTRIYNGATGYRTVSVNALNSAVQLSIVGPNAMIVTASPTGVVSFA